MVLKPYKYIRRLCVLSVFVFRINVLQKYIILRSISFEQFECTHRNEFRTRTPVYAQADNLTHLIAQILGLCANIIAFCLQLLSLLVVVALRAQNHRRLAVAASSSAGRVSHATHIHTRTCSQANICKKHVHKYLPVAHRETRRHSSSPRQLPRARRIRPTQPNKRTNQRPRAP